MKIAIDGTTWEPRVELGGVEVQPYLTLYRQLTDHDEIPRSIYGAIISNIMTLLATKNR